MTSPETLELEAIDAALAGQWVAPEYDELADLALLLRDDRPEPTPAFTTTPWRISVTTTGVTVVVVVTVAVPIIPGFSSDAAIFLPSFGGSGSVRPIGSLPLVGTVALDTAEAEVAGALDEAVDRVVLRRGDMRH